MKNHITFFATFMMLLVFVPKMKAEEVYFLVGQKVNGVVGNFNVYEGKHPMTQVSGNIFKIDIDPTKSDNDIRFYIGLKNANKTLCPYKDDLEIDIHDTFLEEKECDITPTNDVRSWKIKYDAGTYFTIYADISEGNTRVWIESTKKEEVLTRCVDKYIRTYSSQYDMVPLNNDVKIYTAYRYTPPTHNGVYEEGTLEMRELKYIPKNMGVVLIGSEENISGSGETRNFALLKRTDAPETDYRNVWTKASNYENDEWNNFLVPTVEADPNLGNTMVNEAGEIIYRYYGLSNYHRTKYYADNQTGDDYIGFFRLTEDGESHANKAYLSLPASRDVKGGEFGYIDYNAHFAGAVDPNNPALAKMRIIFDDEANHVTEIKNIDLEKNQDNAFYTLQGVKVAQPTKGFYIHNGKKIVLK